MAQKNKQTNISPPMAFDDTLDDIRLHGLHPLLAHPER